MRTITVLLAVSSIHNMSVVLWALIIFEVATNTAQFYQAWVQKNFLDDHVSLLAGLYAIDSEFYGIETVDLFLQPPYGMANEIAQTGANGPPIFPLGALAVHTKLTSPARDLYLQAALT